MAPPTPLAIALQAVNRLVKEESYYHKEQASQEKRITKLEEDIENNSPDLDSNAEYILKQEVGFHLTQHFPLRNPKSGHGTLTLRVENRTPGDQGRV
jgi:hypothetical protein